MAEIRIEEKKSGSFLPWLLGILGMILLVWLAIDFFDADGEPELLTADEVNFPDGDFSDRPDADVINAMDQPDSQVPFDYDDDEEATAVAVANNTMAAPAVSQFMSFVANPQVEMNLDHDYTCKGLNLMAAALMAMENQYDLDDVNVKKTAMMLKQKADILDNDWRSTKHADHIKEAFMAATESMSAIQSAYIPGMATRINKLKQEARDVDPKTLTLSQKEDVKSFFRQYADAINDMANELARM